jgi:hypothetical protein
MATILIFVLTAIIFVLFYLYILVRRELECLRAECEMMFHRDRKTGRIAKGMRKQRV